MKNKWRKVVGIFVYITLLASIIYSIVKIITAASVDTGGTGAHLKSDYILMLFQCILGVIVLGVPAFLEKKFSFEMPNAMSIAYFIFLYCAIYLGEIKQFYYIIPHWDSILHCFSGGMLGAFGFTLVVILNDSEKVRMDINPFFVCLFAFCFAVAIGAIWEIYEFSGDYLLGLNMQKYRLADGTLLVGIDALKGSRRRAIRTRLKPLKIGFFFVVGFDIPRIIKTFRLEKSQF